MNTNPTTTPLEAAGIEIKLARLAELREQKATLRGLLDSRLRLSDYLDAQIEFDRICPEINNLALELVDALRAREGRVVEVACKKQRENCLQEWWQGSASSITVAPMPSLAEVLAQLESK